MTHAVLGFRNPEDHVLYGLAADSDLTSVLSWIREDKHCGAHLVHWVFTTVNALRPVMRFEFLILMFVYMPEVQGVHQCNHKLGSECIALIEC